MTWSIMASEERLVPPTKYILLIAAGLILMMAAGGALGFSDFADDFFVNIDKMLTSQTGYIGPKPGPDGKVTLDLAIDAKLKINETHGVVFWYINITVDLNSTLVDVMSYIAQAKAVEQRIYNLQNTSHWITLLDNNVSKYQLDIKYYNYSNYVNIYSINGIAEDPGSLTQWLTYLWDARKEGFVYLAMSTSRFMPSHGDKIVLVYGQDKTFPSDCCSNFIREYEDYSGPK